MLDNKSKQTVTHFNHFCTLVLLAFLNGKAKFEDQQKNVIDRFVNQKMDVKILCHMLHKHIPMDQRDVMRKSIQEMQLLTANETQNCRLTDD